MILLIALQALLSISLPLQKKLLSYSSPCFLAGSRLLLGGTVLLLYHCFRLKKNVLSDIEYSRAHLWMIVIGVYAKQMLRSWSLQYMSIMKMTFMFNCTPFIAAALSFFIHGERISRQQLLGMGLGFMGVIPLLLIKSEAGCSVGELLRISLPDGALLLAIGAHCYGMESARTLIRDQQKSASLTNGIRMLGGGLLCMLTAFLTEGLFPVTHPAPFFLGLFFLVASTNILCHGWYLGLLQTHSVTLLTLADGVEPFLTVCYGWAFFGERVTWQYVLSTVFALSGLYLFYHAETKKVRSHDAFKTAIG